MTGVAAPNIATFYQAPSGQRATVAAADWAGGMNKGASNAPGIGINTGDHSPKTDDWSEDERLLQESGQFGLATADIEAADGGGVGFLESVAETAVDAQIGVTGYYNLTGAVVPAGAWLWATDVNPAA